MKGRVAMLLPLLLATSPVWATQSPLAAMYAAAPVLPLDASARQEIVAQLANAIRERYVFPEVGRQVATTLTAALAAGRYDSLTDPLLFARRLSEDAAAIAHDKHLNVFSTTEPPSESGAGMLPHSEAGVTRADKLHGDIGYIEVIGFPPAQLSKHAVDTAMSALAGSRTLIIDVRRNGGGDPQAVAYLVSFFVPPGRAINDIVSRVEKTETFTRETYHSVPTPVTFVAAQVYVLTSKDTFSGGEEFAYDVQAFKRGVVIGEATGGGANPNDPVDLGHDIVATIPFGRAENAVTKTNWEGRGVQPDISVPSSEALRTALKKAGQTPVADIASASMQKVFSPRSMPLPGSEAAIRSLVAGYLNGVPDYSIMTPDFATQTRARLSQMRLALAPLGQLRSVAFYRPDEIGGDEYRLTFANGVRKMALVVDQNRKISRASSLAPLDTGE